MKDRADRRGDFYKERFRIRICKTCGVPLKNDKKGYMSKYCFIHRGYFRDILSEYYRKWWARLSPERHEQLIVIRDKWNKLNPDRHREVARDSIRRLRATVPGYKEKTNAHNRAYRLKKAQRLAQVEPQEPQQ